MISYLEIYNEQINDLLNAGSSNLKIHEDNKVINKYYYRVNQLFIILSNFKLKHLRKLLCC